MRIYQPRVVEGFQWVLPINDDDFEIFLGFDGSSRASTWTPARVQLLSADEERTLEKSDFPWLGRHALILSSRAIGAVEGLLRNDGELLPLACDEAALWVFNPTTVVDALDQDRSELVRFNSSGRIMTVTKYVFQAELVGDAVAFKVPEFLRASTFVTERFVDAMKLAGLRGVEFELLWES